MIKDLSPKPKSHIDLDVTSDLPPSLRERVEKCKVKPFTKDEARVLCLFSEKIALSQLEIEVGYYRLSHKIKNEGAMYQMLLKMKQKGFIDRDKKQGSPWVIKGDTLKQFKSGALL